MTNSGKSDDAVDVGRCDTAGTRSSVEPRTAATNSWLELGTILGDWRIERIIGLGGMGTVYEAVHVLIGKRAAIKVVRSDMSPQTADRFVREAWVVNKISHPNVVDIFELGRLDDGRPYLVMELLDGRNLDDRMDEGRVRPDEAINILLQICAAIAAAHAHDVVHRDLKPANIVLVDGEDGVRVKVVDWGIAKLMDQLSEPTSATMSGTLLGTPEHMSPEQARGQADVDGRSDIYALGSIAYELFLEEPPFSADSVAEVLAMHLREAPPPPSDVWPDIPPRLEQLLLGMLAKQPADRPSLDEVIETLLAVRRELAERKHERRARGARDSMALARLVRLPRRRVMRALALTTALALGAGVLALSRGPEAPVAAAAGLGLDDVPVAAATPVPVAADEPAPVLAVERVVIDPPPAQPLTPSVKSKAATTPAKNRSVRRRSAPRIDPDGTIDPFL